MALMEELQTDGLAQAGAAVMEIHHIVVEPLQAVVAMVAMAQVAEQKTKPLMQVT
jgi:hypothetical protein